MGLSLKKIYKQQIYKQQIQSEFYHIIILDNPSIEEVSGFQGLVRG